MKKLALLIVLVAFLGVTAPSVYAAPDSPKTDKKSDKECATKSSDGCKSKCDGKSKKTEAPEKK